MQRRLVVPVPMRFYHDFNILIECNEETQKTLDRKLPELAAQQLGDIGLADAEQTGRLDLFQAALFHDGVDLAHQLRLDQALFRVRDADVLEDVPASGCGLSVAHRAPDISAGWRTRRSSKRRKSRTFIVSNCPTPWTYMLAASRASCTCTP